jgi:hypothetical protein
MDMDVSTNLTEEKVRHSQLQEITAAIQSAAENYQGDTLALLSLLRVLEELHQVIREDLFQDALPTNRQELYSLLKDIETEGGWPYIPRMRIGALLAALQPGGCLSKD